MTQQKNFRLPEITLKKLKALIEATGATETQVVIIAIDRLTEQEIKEESETKPAPSLTQSRL